MKGHKIHSLKLETLLFEWMVLFYMIIHSCKETPLHSFKGPPSYFVYSCVEISQYTTFQLPMLTVSGQQVCVGWWWCVNYFLMLSFVQAERYSLNFAGLNCGLSIINYLSFESMLNYCYPSIS